MTTDELLQSRQHLLNQPKHNKHKLIYGGDGTQIQKHSTQQPGEIVNTAVTFWREKMQTKEITLKKDKINVGFCWRSPSCALSRWTSLKLSPLVRVLSR